MKTLMKTIDKELNMVRGAYNVLHSFSVGDCFTLSSIPEEDRKNYRETEVSAFSLTKTTKKYDFNGATAKALVARGILAVVSQRDTFIHLHDNIYTKNLVNVYKLIMSYDDYKKTLQRQLELRI